MKQSTKFGHFSKKTVSNAKISSPAKCAADLFDQNPLIKRVSLEDWNIQEENTKRNKRQYIHQYHVEHWTSCTENFARRMRVQKLELPHLLN